MGLLAGKKGLILNIANDRSIAWHIAVNAIKHGAACGFGYLPVERMERRVRKAMEEAIRTKKPTLINAVIDETAGTESGRITSLNPTAGKKK